jgi:hypothetical protein
LNLAYTAKRPVQQHIAFALRIIGQWAKPRMTPSEGGQRFRILKEANLQGKVIGRSLKHPLAGLDPGSLSDF